MEVTLTRQTRPYPRYLYHQDYSEPKIVNSKAEETELNTKGWIASYIHKDYPKWVGDKIVRSKEEEERLLASQADLVEGPPFDIPDDVFTEPGPGVTVVKEIQVDGVDSTVVEKPKKKPIGRPKKK